MEQLNYYKNIYYFVDEKEHNPVKGFIESLTLKEQADNPKNCLDLCTKRKNEVKQYAKTEKLGI